MEILVIDDDRKLCRLIKEYLKPMGFRITEAHSSSVGLELALSGRFEAVILDVMMPGMDGFEALRRLRQKSDVPVLMFTARGDETDRIVGLEMGADDYIPKTFSSRELLARLRAVMRRSSRSYSDAARPDQAAVSKSGPGSIGGQAEGIIAQKDLRINMNSRTVYQDDRVLELTPLEFDLLSTLAGNPGRVLTRDTLMEAVSGRDYMVFDRSIDVHISSLRKKLGDDPKAPGYIKTVRSVGYMFLD
ncbi:MAG TPA: response regulator transcription factor [Thermodesulfobacteriaceae bacterium]|nr:response regulator transcription factor [Thermodesulfobacteriaceae bacterium]